jgi:hypothetical protein
MPNTRDYTNLEISQRLKELGFTAETDAWWVGDRLLREERMPLYPIIDTIPAFSTQTLLDVLPRKVQTTTASHEELLTINPSYTNEWKVKYDSELSTYPELNVISDTLANALGKMVIELLNKGIKLNV